MRQIEKKNPVIRDILPYRLVLEFRNNSVYQQKEPQVFQANVEFLKCKNSCKLSMTAGRFWVVLPPRFPLQGLPVIFSSDSIGSVAKDPWKHQQNPPNKSPTVPNLSHQFDKLPERFIFFFAGEERNAGKNVVEKWTWWKPKKEIVEHCFCYFCICGYHQHDSKSNKTSWSTGVFGKTKRWTNVGIFVFNPGSRTGCNPFNVWVDENNSTFEVSDHTSSPQFVGLFDTSWISDIQRWHHGGGERNSGSFIWTSIHIPPTLPSENKLNHFDFVNTHKRPAKMQTIKKACNPKNSYVKISESQSYWCQWHTPHRRDRSPETKPGLQCWDATFAASPNLAYLLYHIISYYRGNFATKANKIKRIQLVMGITILQHETHVRERESVSV